MKKNKIIHNKKLLLMIIIIVVAVISFSNLAISEQITRDVELTIILEKPEPNQTIDKIFKAENLNHVTGQTDNLHFILEANISKYNLTKYYQDTNTTINSNLTNIIYEYLIMENLFNNYSWNATRTINKYTETGFGELTLETGIYYLCAEIIPINFQDPNISNNKECKLITTYDVDLPQQQNNGPEEPAPCEGDDCEEDICDCELSILANKKIYEAGETISFVIQDCWNTTTYENEITYWAEDLFGTITRNLITTKIKTPKSYTPNIKEIEKTFLIKAKINTCEKEYQTIVTFKNEAQEQKETYLEIITKEEAKPGETIIIEIKGYKANTQKKLLTTQLNQENKRVSEQLKSYIHKTNSEFHFKIPLKIPENLPAGTHEYSLITEGLDIIKENIIIITMPENIIQEKPLIKNFQTRKQKFEEDINVILSWVGPQETTARITTQKQTLEIKLNKTPQTIPVKIQKHNETIIAELLINNETQDIKILKLNLEEQQEKEKEENIQQGEQIQNQEEIPEIKAINEEETQNQTNQFKQENINQENEAEETKTITKITSKTTSFIKNNKKQTIFILLAILAIIFLFKKEIIKTIKNKKNKIKF